MESLPRRIGVLVPGLDPVVEHDFQRYLPDEVSFHVGRLVQPPDSKTATDESLSRMCEDAPRVAGELAGLEPELILFCCTSASFFKGVGWDRTVSASIEEATGVPALATSTAVAEALGAFGIRRAFMVTPYGRSINEREQRFFAGHGVEISAFTSFECERSRDIDKVTPRSIVERVLDRREAIEPCDGVFVSCTALRSMEAIETLERSLDKPVVTSNAAALWAALHRLGVDASGVPAGRLFGLPAPSSRARVA